MPYALEPPLVPTDVKLPITVFQLAHDLKLALLAPIVNGRLVEVTVGVRVGVVVFVGVTVEVLVTVGVLVGVFVVVSVGVRVGVTVFVGVGVAVTLVCNNILLTGLIKNTVDPTLDVFNCPLLKLIELIVLADTKEDKY